MKNVLNYVFLGILVLSLGACAKTESPDISKDATLIGRWNVTRGTEKVYVNNRLTQEYDTSNPQDGYEIEVAQFRFIDDDNLLLIFSDGEQFLTDYKRSSDGKTLSILGLSEDGDDWGTLHIKKLTSQDMELLIEETETENNSVTRYEVQLFLKKVG